MEDRIKKRRKIVSYIVDTFFICVVIYFTVLKFILKVDVTEYNIYEKLVLLSAPVVQIVRTFTEKLYYATIFWIFVVIILIFGFFFFTVLFQNIIF